MKISVLSDKTSWINDSIPEFISDISSRGHEVFWFHEVLEILEGDIAFFLGCGQIVPTEILKRNQHNLVVHESALPKGRGWSPLTWQILNGDNEIQIVLFEAEESIDSGKIYLQETMKFTGQELVDELRKVQAEFTFNMCRIFIEDYPDIVNKGRVQSGDATYFAKRTPQDSRLDPDRTIREQFNLLRVVDNEHYPAFFELSGERYIIKIYKDKLTIKENKIDKRNQ